jgi:hypothetical protein
MGNGRRRHFHRKGFWSEPRPLFALMESFTGQKTIQQVARDLRVSQDAVRQARSKFLRTIRVARALEIGPDELDVSNNVSDLLAKVGK